MRRHTREDYHVVREGIWTYDDRYQGTCRWPSTIAELRKFQFSRMGPKGEKDEQLDDKLRTELAIAMTAVRNDPLDSNPPIPAGFSYLGQFIDHDLTFDRTGRALGQNVSVDELVQGRSPALDLDSLYGRGPGDVEDSNFYRDGARLKIGTTAAIAFPQGDPVIQSDLEGFDLPRSGLGSSKSERRRALIADPRNDENLAVAQTHVAFIRFHNRVVKKLARKGTPNSKLFHAARRRVVKHYQWMIRWDFLPRIIDQKCIDDVFNNGREFFEAAPQLGAICTGYSRQRMQPGDMPTMPIEFSVAAYRLHCMIGATYQWNRVFRFGGSGGAAPLALLLNFSGMNGTLSPDHITNPNTGIVDAESGSFERLPTNWIADFRRLYDFGDAGRNDLKVNPLKELNVAKRIDTVLVDPLSTLQPGAFLAAGTTPPARERNLAFRNLTRAQMVELATGQQMAHLMGVPPLTAEQILVGNGGAVLDGLSRQQKDALTANTPLWFYVLREAELNGGRLTGVGGRIVAEVFHRAMEGSRISILRNRNWRPSLGPDRQTFRMVDLLLFAFEGKAELLNPLGD